MNSYQYTISLNGHFFLRTDWVQDNARANSQMIELRNRFPASEGWKITREEKSNVVESVTIHN